MKDKLKKMIVNLIPDYKSMVNDSNNIVLCSYINDGFILSKNSKKLLTHGNKIESIIIKEVFNELGFNFISIRYNKKINLKKYKDMNPKIIFGIEPNFEKLCEEFPNAIKIYYATGAYVDHQNSMVIKRTDEVNAKKNSNIPYYRTVKENKAARIADYIIQIGSKYTIETYPEELRKKILLIRQSSFEFLNLEIDKKKNIFSTKDYLWFGSNGSILKGLDLVIEYFKKNEDLNLHIIGPLDKEFEDVYRNELYKSRNIKYHGYIPIYDSRLIEITNKCTFILYPSASEGGVPGSVLNMMRLGLIPIVSKYASFNEIKEIGFLLDDLSIESISKTIKLTQSLSKDDIINNSRKSYEYVNDNHNLMEFENDIRLMIQMILN